MYVENIGSSYMQNSSDLSQIEQIKRGTKSSKEQLKKVATEFESIFVALYLNPTIHFFVPQLFV